MKGIAKTDNTAAALSHKTEASSVPPSSVDPSSAALALWTAPGTGLLHRIAAHLQAAGLHPARTVVLLPYAHLRPQAARLWARLWPDGFTPRFETTMSWSTALHAAPAQATDLHFDMALDSLSAHALLCRAGLEAHAAALTGVLVQSAQQLAPLAAACAPAQRSAWAERARAALQAGQLLSPNAANALQWEAAVARIALEWAALSNYASDVLFAPEATQQVDSVVWVDGLRPEPLAAGLQALWGTKMLRMALVHDNTVPTTGWGRMALHACADAQEEAQRVAAVALRHIAAGRFPLALASSDRALTRRVRALLEGAGVQIRDETGWKLSTSAAAAQVVACLNAGVWNASSDAVLDWIKAAPLLARGADALEARLRAQAVRDWRAAGAALGVRGTAQAADPPPSAQAAQALYEQVEALRSGWQGRHGVLHWLEQLRRVLQGSGLWEPLCEDAAGAQLLAVLQLGDAQQATWAAQAQDAWWAQRRMDFSEFSAWVRQALEAATFQPPYPLAEEVVILPLEQMLGRVFAAAVVAGCDEVRLPASTPPPGLWSPAQREALGLPSRAVLDGAARAAWWHALQTPVCEVLWRSSDDSAEPLMPSPWVLQLQARLQTHLEEAQAAPPEPPPDPRALRRLECVAVLPPEPQAPDLLPQTLSQGAYEDLRKCPYRFFALRQLGLTPAQELDAEVGKRDWGVWLHAVLGSFHTTCDTTRSALEADAHAARARWAQALDAASALVTRRMGLSEAEFLPFAAAWPAVREGYLQWLLEHVQTDAQFASAESVHSQALAWEAQGPTGRHGHTVTLRGRVDRMDLVHSAGAASPLLMDYKTESLANTRNRVKEPLEDTQIAFYAALLTPADSAANADTHENTPPLRAGYLNLSEGLTQWVEQPEVEAARAALCAGIAADFGRIAQGASLRALGDGAACDFCQARGLCRKDFWTPA